MAAQCLVIQKYCYHFIDQSSGFLKVSKVSLDDSKTKANASKHKALGYAHMLASYKNKR